MKKNILFKFVMLIVAGLMMFATIFAGTNAVDVGVSGILNVVFNEEEAYGDDPAYFIRINVACNCLTVYQKGSTGEYTVAVKSMACSIIDGADASNATYTFTSTKQKWHKFSNGNYSRYYSKLNNNIAICTALYTDQGSDKLIMDEYNKIGSESNEHGIYLCSSSARWIYENCGEGTGVEIYEDEEEASPLGMPHTIILNENSKYTNWDPTDESENNPWRNEKPVLKGVKDLDVKLGDEEAIMKKVTGYDVCGNDITDYIIITGYYNINKEGSYDIAYNLQDGTGNAVQEKATITVHNKTYVKEDEDNSSSSSSGSSTSSSTGGTSGSSSSSKNSSGSSSGTASSGEIGTNGNDSTGNGNGSTETEYNNSSDDESPTMSMNKRIKTLITILIISAAVTVYLTRNVGSKR